MAVGSFSDPLDQSTIVVLVTAKYKPGSNITKIASVTKSTKHPQLQGKAFMQILKYYRRYEAYTHFEAHFITEK